MYFGEKLWPEKILFGHEKANPLPNHPKSNVTGQRLS